MCPAGYRPGSDSRPPISAAVKRGSCAGAERPRPRCSSGGRSGIGGGSRGIGGIGFVGRLRGGLGLTAAVVVASCAAPPRSRPPPAISAATVSLPHREPAHQPCRPSRSYAGTRQPASALRALNQHLSDGSLDGRIGHTSCLGSCGAARAAARTAGLGTPCRSVREFAAGGRVVTQAVETWSPVALRADPAHRPGGPSPNGPASGAGRSRGRRRPRPSAWLPTRPPSRSISGWRFW